jgi:hypothetical protein
VNLRLIRGFISLLVIGSIWVVASQFIPERIVLSQSSSGGGPRPIDHITQPHAGIQDYAVQLRQQLIDGKTSPAWDDRSQWSNQCQVGLMNFPCQPADKVLNEHQLFFESMTIPPQIGGEPEFFPPLERKGKQVIPAALQSIYYNRSAAESIKQNDLADGRAINSRFNALNTNRVALSDMSIQDFGSDAMVIKTIWETVVPPTRFDPPWVQANGYYRGIHLYSNQIQCTGPTCKLPKIHSWDEPQDQVYVDVSKDTSCQFQRVQGHRVYSLGCFYHREVTADDFKQLSGHPHSDFPDLIDQDCASKKCEMVMVGFHVMTRETPNWIWATFWWQDTISQIGGATLEPWSFFQSKATINSQDAVANPYLEGPTQPGMNSNCLDCHRFAIFSPQFASPLAKIIANPTPADRDLGSPNSCFVSGIQTHFLWTIALHAYYTNFGTSGPSTSCLDQETNPPAPLKENSIRR